MPPRLVPLVPVVQRTRTRADQRSDSRTLAAACNCPDRRASHSANPDSFRGPHVPAVADVLRRGSIVCAMPYKRKAGRRRTEEQSGRNHSR